MKKMMSILFVSLMVIAFTGIVYAEVYDISNDLEELVGLEVKIWYSNISFLDPYCKGMLVARRGNWLIVRDKEGTYNWCHISKIRKIQILDEDYIPAKKIGKEKEK